MRKIGIEAFEDLQLIIDEIHDCWFDIENIDLTEKELSIEYDKEDRSNSILVKNYFLWKRVKVPVRKYHLRIHNVQYYKIVDNESIGLYDFDTIEYDRDRSVLIIKTGVPLVFEISVEKFKMAIEYNNKVLKWKKKIKFRTSCRHFCT